MANEIEFQARKPMSKVINLEKFRPYQGSKDSGTEIILKMSEKHAEKFRKLEDEFFCLADSMYHDFKSENMLLGSKNHFLKATLAGFAKEMEEMINTGFS